MVLDAGGNVVTVLDLADVYMTIFLPAVRAARNRNGAFRRGDRALPPVGESLASVQRVESFFAPR